MAGSLAIRIGPPTKLTLAAAPLVSIALAPVGASGRVAGFDTYLSE
jgi:hypothetical protein